MSKIKYAQIGVGHPHASKMRVYRESSDYDVVGVAEPDVTLRSRAERDATYQGLDWLSVDDLLAVPGLQVVGVETELAETLDVAEKCLAAGKHIHVDKPAGTSLTQWKRILDEAARQHLAVQMGFMYRYNPAVVLMRDCLQKGWLGEPFELHAVMSKRIADEARGEDIHRIGGTMLDLGSHLIDLVVGVFGEPQQVHPFPRHSSALDDGLMDNMLAVLEYPRATATVRTSIVEVDGGARRHLALCGTEGTFHIQPLDNPQARVAFSEPRGRFKQGYQDVTFPKYTRYVADAADLAKIVRREKDADFSYAHDLAVQRTVLLASGLPTDV
ncbi:MAG: Gfo/Idh/MocA family protein [Planctomycetaceae bacterium]